MKDLGKNCGPKNWKKENRSTQEKSCQTIWIFQTVLLDTRVGNHNCTKSGVGKRSASKDLEEQRKRPGNPKKRVETEKKEEGCVTRHTGACR